MKCRCSSHPLHRAGIERTPNLDKERSLVWVKVVVRDVTQENSVFSLFDLVSHQSLPFKSGSLVKGQQSIVLLRRNQAHLPKVSSNRFVENIFEKPLTDTLSLMRCADNYLVYPAPGRLGPQVAVAHHDSIQFGDFHEDSARFTTREQGLGIGDPVKGVALFEGLLGQARHRPYIR